MHPLTASCRQLPAITNTSWRREEHTKGESSKSSMAPSLQSYSPQATDGAWATMAFKRLASLLSNKRVQPYNRTLGFLRCKVAFTSLDSAIMCLRGARSSFHSPAHNNADLQDLPLDLIAREARLSD